MKTLDEFIAELQVLRNRHGGDPIVINADGNELTAEFNDDGVDAIVIE